MNPLTKPRVPSLMELCEKEQIFAPLCVGLPHDSCSRGCRVQGGTPFRRPGGREHVRCP